MRAPAADPQPLTRTLAARWLGQRPHWFARAVECPVRAVDPDGAWRGRLATPPPRVRAVRLTDWACWLSTGLERPVSGGQIMETAGECSLDRVPGMLALLNGVRNWRRARMGIGPFKEPDSQDVFQILLTEQLLRSAK